MGRVVEIEMVEITVRIRKDHCGFLERDAVLAKV
jgi:hypothetical protein